MKQFRDTKIALGTALVLCAVTAAGAAAGCCAVFGWRTRAVQVKLREIDAVAADRYVGEFDAEKVADYAATGYVAGLNDRWSSYIPADEYEAYTLRSEGQGCGIGLSVVTRDKEIRVSEVYDDSPAQKAGIEKGDYLTGAEGLTAEKDGAAAVLAAIGGEEGGAVTVTVRKEAAGEDKTLTMTRAIVTQKMAWGELLPGNIGYIRINNFHAGSAEQYQKALDALTADGAVSLLLDVRHNGGGRVQEMSDMLDPLLPEGTIMTMKSKDGRETVYSSDAEKTDLPAVVLVDDESISAAEFFAAALQEYGRATLVGAHTTGKGRAQQTYRLSDGSALNLSTEQYYTPKGNSLADTGVAPDVELALTDAQKDEFPFLTLETDPQMQKAVEILS